MACTEPQCLYKGALYHYLVVAEVSERSAVGKPAAQKFDGKRFLRKVNELEVRKHYQIEVSNRFAALESLNDSKDINRAWENIKENIKTSTKGNLDPHELKQHIPWFDEECLGLLDQRNQAKVQRVQDPSQSIVDNLKNVKDVKLADISGINTRNIGKLKLRNFSLTVR